MLISRRLLITKVYVFNLKIVLNTHKVIALRKYFTMKEEMKELGDASADVGCGWHRGANAKCIESRMTMGKKEGALARNDDI